MPKWITNTTCHQLIGLKKLNTCHKNKIHLATHLIAYMQLSGAYSQSKYLKRQSNEKRTTKDYFGFLLHLLFHEYTRLVYDYN
jgi:hypothetical protein